MFPEATQYTVTDRIGYIYSELFGLIYPYVHSHFVSYSLILLVSVGVVWGAFNRLKRSRSSGAKLGYTAVIVMVGSFSVWLVLFHFHTFMQADLYYETPSEIQPNPK